MYNGRRDKAKFTCVYSVITFRCPHLTGTSNEKLKSSLGMIDNLRVESRVHVVGNTASAQPQLHGKHTETSPRAIVSTKLSCILYNVVLLLSSSCVYRPSGGK